jgi:hypothetical protein
MPASTTYRGRRAALIENDHLRVTALTGGGHLAEIHHKKTGVNPLWTPPWTSMEPSQYDATRHPEYGGTVESSLLAGIMGHNLCLDIFGGPSEAEARAGLPVHGEVSTAEFEISGTADEILMRARLPRAGLQIERQIGLRNEGVWIRETLENPGGVDKPIGWTEHVTLGPPFLERGRTQFRASVTRSRVFEAAFGAADYLRAGADFEWPRAPRIDGGIADLRVFTEAAASSAYTAHLTDPARPTAFFVAFAPAARLAFGCLWKRADFPWLGIWEENCSRTQPPWNSRTITRGMEFGASPFPETRRAMVERGRLFETPGFKWIPAQSRVSIEYWCVSALTETIPETLEWPPA